jgi:hypothetical protein
LALQKELKIISDILAIFDKFYPRINFDFLKSKLGEEKLIKVIKIVFADYKSIKDIYPISFLRYQRIKSYVLKKL